MSEDTHKMRNYVAEGRESEALKEIEECIRNGECEALLAIAEDVRLPANIRNAAAKGAEKVAIGLVEENIDKLFDAVIVKDAEQASCKESSIEPDRNFLKGPRRPGAFDEQQNVEQKKQLNTARKKFTPVF